MYAIYGVRSSRLDIRFQSLVLRREIAARHRELTNRPGNLGDEESGRGCGAWCEPGSPRNSRHDDQRNSGCQHYRREQPFRRAWGYAVFSQTPCGSRTVARHSGWSVTAVSSPKNGASAATASPQSRGAISRGVYVTVDEPVTINRLVMTASWGSVGFSLSGFD